MSALRRRLLLAEDDFLDALQRGGDSVDAFDKRWAALLVDVEVAEEKGDLDTETLELAHATALRLSILIDTSVDVLAIHDQVTSDLIGQLDNLMSDLSLSGSISLPHPAARRASSPSSDSTTHSLETLPSSSRKRRRSADDDEAIVISVSKKRRNTNSRSPSPSILTSQVASLPSLSNQPALDAASERGHTRGTKRCLSDTKATFSRPSKRMHAGPRLHAVSDSFSPVISSHSHIPAKNLTTPPTEPPRVDTTSTLFDIQPYVVPTDVMLTLQPSDSLGLGDLWSMLHSPVDILGCNDVDTSLYSPGGLSCVTQPTNSLRVTPTDSTPSTPSSISSSLSPITPALDARLDGSIILDPDSFSLDSYGFSPIDPAVSFSTKLLVQSEDGDVHPSLDNQRVDDCQRELDPLFWLATSLPDCSQPNMAFDRLDTSVLISPQTFVSADCIDLVTLSPVQPV